MPRWLYFLLLAAPVALVGKLFQLPSLLVFIFAILGIIPLAALIGQATDVLSEYTGPKVGGVLNATFGNATELIITLFALHAGLFDLIRASLTGSIIGNALLVLGAALLLGGWRHGRQSFDTHDAGQYASMMVLAVIGLFLPTSFGVLVSKQSLQGTYSLFVAGILLILYVAYLAFSVFGLRDQKAAAPAGAREGKAEKPRWSFWITLAILLGATVGTALVSEALVGSIEPVTKQLGLSESFIGVIIVPILGNAGESAAALRMALQNKLDLTFGITAGSSLQVALLVGPLLVLLSPLTGHVLTLSFRPLEFIVLGLATLIFAFVSVDGKTNWLEGIQLLGVYAMAAVAFFLLPH